MTTIPPHGLFQQAFSFTHITQVENLDPFILPSIALEERAKLPSVSAIYFVILEVKILYIGKSINLRKRWKRHHRIEELQSCGNAMIAWFHFVNIEQNLEELEEECISHFKPLLNGTLRPDPPSPEQSFGNRLKELREKRGITQEDLAGLIDVKDSRTIRFWESGTNTPKFASLVALAQALNVKMRDFFTFPDNPDL
jgi:DNA-binding XRE family transcriptional regulator